MAEKRPAPPGEVMRNTLPFQLEEPVREPGRVLVASGGRSRNRDWWTGKPYRLIPSGMRLDNWKKNPLVLWMHNFNIPLAKGDLYLEDGKLWAEDDFDFHRRTIPVAVDGWGGSAIGSFDTGVIADLWQEEFYNAVSIHVMFSREDEEVVVEQEDEIVFPSSEVIEFSVVTVPGDPAAVREELMDRLVHKGVDADVANCVACEGGLMFNPSLGVWMPSSALSIGEAANSGSTVHPVAKREVIDMEDETLVEEEELDTAAADDETTDDAVVEEEEAEVEIVEAEEAVVEVVEEIELDTADLVQAIIEDETALAQLTKALLSHPSFAEALLRSNVVPVETELVAEVIRPRVKFVTSGQPRQATVAHEAPVRSVAQTAQPARPRVTERPARPVAAPGATERRKPSALDLVRQ